MSKASPKEKTTVTIDYADGRPQMVIEFAELNSVSVNHDIREKERFDGYLDYECRSTTITLTGKLAGGKPEHEHHWKRDSFGATNDGDQLHYGLTCECGAIACGTADLSHVHNVREYEA